jgi:hypothetical protein
MRVFAISCRRAGVAIRTTEQSHNRRRQVPVLIPTNPVRRNRDPSVKPPIWRVFGRSAGSYGPVGWTQRRLFRRCSRNSQRYSPPGQELFSVFRTTASETGSHYEETRSARRRSPFATSVFVACLAHGHSLARAGAARYSRFVRASRMDSPSRLGPGWSTTGIFLPDKTHDVSARRRLRSASYLKFQG